jgi:hypothetical protein
LSLAAFLATSSTFEWISEDRIKWEDQRRKGIGRLYLDDEVLKTPDTALR